MSTLGSRINMETPRRDESAATNASSILDTPNRRHPVTPLQVTNNNFDLRSANRSVRHTPRGVGVGPSTPHALRAFQRRAATQTPARDRRKSVRAQRETPLDILRNLGKALAPTTETIVSSSSSSARSSLSSRSSGKSQQERRRNMRKLGIHQMDDLDIEADIPKPRLSLPLSEMGVDEENSSPEIQPPPRLSMVPFDEDDGDLTSKSIEAPRRADSAREQALTSRLSMLSRFSDQFGDVSHVDDTEEIEYTVGDDFIEQGDNTMQPIADTRVEAEDLQRFDFEINFPAEEEGDPGFEIDGNDTDNLVLDQTPLDFEDPPHLGAQLSSDNDDEGPGLQLAGSNTSEGDLSQAESEPKLDQESKLEANPARSRGKGLTAPLPEDTGKPTVSQHGMVIPRLPSRVVKKLANRFAKGPKGNVKLNKDTLVAIEQATEWFFEQITEDLSTYSKHAGRKTIDETDLITLMKRQRFIGRHASMFSIAQKHLPGELLQDVHLGKR